MHSLKVRPLIYRGLNQRKLRSSQLIYAQRLLINMAKFAHPHPVPPPPLEEAKLTTLYPWTDELEAVFLAARFIKFLPAPKLAAYAEIQATIEKHLPFEFLDNYYIEALPNRQPGLTSPAKPHSKKLAWNLIEYEDEALLEKKYETLTVLAEDGTVKLNRLGETHMVELVGWELAAYRNTIITHTHPGPSSFSFADLHFCLYLDLQEMRVACMDKGRKTIYRVIRPKSGWPEWYDLLPLALETLGQLAKERRARVAAGQLSHEEAFKWQYHQLWTQVSQALNFDYRQEIQSSK